MTQNIYDDPTFYQAYRRLDRSVQGLGGAPEWPALQALLPDVRRARIVDLGCGFGWVCRWAREKGAASVLGVDVSENMLAQARSMTADPGISYEKADLERLQLPVGSFDVAYSSLALHYVENLGRLFEQINRATVSGGRLVFSVEHPLFTAPSCPDWIGGAGGRCVWPLDGYLSEGPRSTDWLAKGVIKQHRTIATYLNLLIAAKFTILHVEEWGPTPEQITTHPSWALERERPAFLLISAQR
jgi:SAM-dependent methyltransferase